MNIRQAVLAAGAAGLALTFAAQPSAAGPEDHETLRVTVILDCCPGNVFWEPLIHGAEEAGRLFNVDVDIQNQEGDPERQVNLIETAITNRQHGVVPMIAVEDTATAVIQKAMDNGVRVIIANMDDPDGTGPGGTVRMAYVGQDLEMSGYLIGRRMVAEHGLKSGDHCVTPVEFPEDVYAQERYAGVKRALDESGVSSEAIGTGGVVEENQNTVAEYLVSHPETDCAIGLGNAPTSVLPQAAEDAGMEGLPNGGFDINPRVMDNINSGLTTATMDQQAFWQGFLPVMFIAYNVRYGLMPGDVDTGMGIVDKTNAAIATEWAGTYR